MRGLFGTPRPGGESRRNLDGAARRSSRLVSADLNAGRRPHRPERRTAHEERDAKHDGHDGRPDEERDVEARRGQNARRERGGDRPDGSRRAEDALRGR